MPTQAAINDQIHFQGKVVNSDSTNVTDGDYSFTFTIYDAATVGTTLWTETKTITVTDGIFATDLGSVTDLPGSIDFNSDSLYLGVEFNSDGEMSPRIRLTAVPYAFNAEMVNGLTVTDTDGTLTIPNATIAFSGNNDVTLTSTGATTLTLPTTGTLATLAGTETFSNKTISSGGLAIESTGWIGLASGDGRIVFTDAATDTVNILNANVGIGTSSTGSRLDVLAETGNANIAQFIGERDGQNINVFIKHTSAFSTNNSARLTFQLNTSTQLRTAFELISGFADTTDGSRTSITHFASADDGSYGNRMTLYGGSLGIGLENPTARLDVNGTASTSATLSFRGTTDPKINILNGETFGIRTSVGGDDGLTERFTVLNNGNIGIGATFPLAKLHVQDATNPGIIAVDSTNAVVTFIQSLDTAGIAGTSSNHPYAILTGSQSRMTFDTTGNVGIGTAVPNTMLNVAGYMAATGATLSATYAGGTSLTLKAGPSATADILRWQNSSSTTLGVIDKNGNLGIGTSGPLTIFNLVGTAANVPILRNTASPGGTPASIVDFAYSSASNLGKIGMISANSTDTFYVYGAAARQIAFGAASATTPHLLINTSGSVGIGTVNPARLLTVAGAMRLGSVSTPSSPALGDVYTNADGNLYFYNGSGWDVLSGGEAGVFTSSQQIVLDADDSSDSYIQFDNTNNRVEIFADGSERFRFTASGNNESNGSLTTTLSDIAENYPTMNENLQPGEVIMIADTPEYAPATNLVDTADNEHRQNVLGVVSSRPGIILGGSSFLSDICQAVSASQSGALAKREELLQQEYLLYQLNNQLASNASDSAVLGSSTFTIDELTALLPETTLKTIEDRLNSCKSVKQVPIALAGRVPVKFDASRGEVKPGDLLSISASQPGYASKATSAGWILGRALESSGPDSETVMMFVNVTWYGGNDQFSSLSQIQNDIQLSADTKVSDLLSTATSNGNQFLVSSSNLSVFGVMTAQKVVALDSISTGMLTISGANNEITTLNGSSLKLQNGYGAGNIEAFNKKLVFTAEGGVVAEDVIAAKRFAGSDDSRGSVYATSNKIRVDKNWETEPTSINLTSEYRADVWVSDISKDGFYINAEPFSDNKKIYWLAVW